MQESLPLRTFVKILGVAQWILIVVTPLTVLMVGLAWAGVATTSVSGTFDVPATIDLEDGSKVEFTDSNLSFTDVPDENRYVDRLERPTHVHGNVEIAKSDIPSRILASLALLSWIAGAWVIVRSLRPAAQDALAGRPFETSTVKGLRRVGFALLIVPSIGLAIRLLLQVTLETSIPFDPAMHYSYWFGLWFVGLGILGLAEIFASGQRLQEFEASTI